MHRKKKAILGQSQRRNAEIKCKMSHSNKNREDSLEHVKVITYEEQINEDVNDTTPSLPPCLLVSRISTLPLPANHYCPASILITFFIHQYKFQ